MMFGSKLETRRFEDRIQMYESVPVQEGKILFYGHSFFTKCSWITSCPENPLLENCVRMKDGSQAIVNHGFGGSCADDLLYYYHRMVLPWKPRALVLATSSNDIVWGYSAEEIMELAVRLIQWVQADFPCIPICCFSDEPSIVHKGKRDRYTQVRDAYNAYLEEFCAQTENCIYVPVEKQPFWYADPAHIGDYDRVREDIFHEDKVHLNALGYTLFMDFIRDLLDDLL